MGRVYNSNIQEFMGIKFKLIVYTDNHSDRPKAKSFLLLTPEGEVSDQNFWIPNRFLREDGTIIPNLVGRIFNSWEVRRKMELAGYCR